MAEAVPCSCILSWTTSASRSRRQVVELNGPLVLLNYVLTKIIWLSFTPSSQNEGRLPSCVLSCCLNCPICTTSYPKVGSSWRVNVIWGSASDELKKMVENKVFQPRQLFAVLLFSWVLKKLKTWKFLLSDIFIIKLKIWLDFLLLLVYPTDLFHVALGCVPLCHLVLGFLSCCSLPGVTVCTGGAKALSCAVLMTWGLPHDFSL